MTTAVYDVGDTEEFRVTFRNNANPAVVTDPTTVTFRMRKPDGTTTAYVYGTDAEVVKVSTGIYYVNWSFTIAGRHTVRWEGTGAVAPTVQEDVWARRKGTN